MEIIQRNYNYLNYQKSKKLIDNNRFKIRHIFVFSVDIDQTRHDFNADLESVKSSEFNIDNIV